MNELQNSVQNLHETAENELHLFAQFCICRAGCNANKINELLNSVQNLHRGGRAESAHILELLRSSPHSPRGLRPGAGKIISFSDGGSAPLDPPSAGQQAPPPEPSIYRSKSEEEGRARAAARQCARPGIEHITWPGRLRRLKSVLRTGEAGGRYKEREIDSRPERELHPDVKKIETAPEDWHTARASMAAAMSWCEDDPEGKEITGHIVEASSQPQITARVARVLLRAWQNGEIDLGKAKLLSYIYGTRSPRKRPNILYLINNADELIEKQWLEVQHAANVNREKYLQVTRPDPTSFYYSWDTMPIRFKGSEPGRVLRDLLDGKYVYPGRGPDRNIPLFILYFCDIANSDVFARTYFQMRDEGDRDLENILALDATRRGVWEDMIKGWPALGLYDKEYLDVEIQYHIDDCESNAAMRGTTLEDDLKVIEVMPPVEIASGDQNAAANEITL